jgi:hypothetical protein
LNSIKDPFSSVLSGELKIIICLAELSVIILPLCVAAGKARERVLLTDEKDSNL